MSSSDVAALILAGGKATRFGGIAKHALVIDGRTILERQLAVLTTRVAEVVISAPLEVPGFRTVRDVVGEGPLAGIAAGLAAITQPWTLVLAGDMPFITPAVIDSLIAARAPDLDAVGLEVRGLPEPLCCLLHTRTRAAVERRLAAGRFKASGLLTDEGLSVRWLTDADPAALRNLNSPSDIPD
ncbi:MAG: molybdenum cofactor guanylyltransferase [Deltaproteobacteria bacterium]